MIRKRSKFLTFLFALLPGAGHMFMGFMKMGLSFMAAFFAIIFIGAWVRIEAFLFALPVLWFYAFFDCINRAYASDEEFARFEDSYLISSDRLSFLERGMAKRRHLLFGLLLLLLGLYMLWTAFLSGLYRYIPEAAYQALRSVTNVAPQLFVGVLIVVIGVRLIINKKKEDEGDA